MNQDVLADKGTACAISEPTICAIHILGYKSTSAVEFFRYGENLSHGSSEGKHDVAHVHFRPLV
jgi:hypothetical protein